MEQQQDKQPFPGQETGLIRVLIKRFEHEESVQLSFDLIDDEPNMNT